MRTKINILVPYLFPCDDHFLFCNTWGQPCSKAEELEQKIQNSQVKNLVFVYNGLANKTSRTNEQYILGKK